MKYVVITAKHHDGFAMYDSQFSDWNVVKASAAHRDLVAPLADAVRGDGLKFGLYYSQAQDWVHPGGGNYGNASRGIPVNLAIMINIWRRFHYHKFMKSLPSFTPRLFGGIPL